MSTIYYIFRHNHLVSSSPGTVLYVGPLKLINSAIEKHHGIGIKFVEMTSYSQYQQYNCFGNIYTIMRII